MPIHGRVGEALRGAVTSYDGFLEETVSPMVRREGPGRHVVVILSFCEDWEIDGQRLISFAAGLRSRQVTTRHEGRSFGIHVNVSPPAARRLFGLPLHELAERQVPLEDVLEEPFLVERQHPAESWEERFGLLNDVFARHLAAAPPPSPEIVWAWTRLLESDGAVRIGALSRELGWSRKRIAARFRDHVGLTPKRAARLLRFERARELAESAARPDWAGIAREAGYFDQAHLINEFRSFTSRTPETFFQDTVAMAS
jgi:AraC-like DNA-binding protein